MSLKSSFRDDIFSTTTKIIDFIGWHVFRYVKVGGFIHTLDSVEQETTHYCCWKSGWKGSFEGGLMCCYVSRYLLKYYEKQAKAQKNRILARDPATSQTTWWIHG